MYFRYKCLHSVMILALLCVAGSAIGADAVEFLPDDDIFWSGRAASPRPKTLFQWAVGEFEEAEPPGPDRIVTDRPHIAEASSLVGLGRIQFEMGYSRFGDVNSGTRLRTHSAPEMLMRAGIFAEWFEFRLGYNYLIQHNIFSGGTRTRLSGSDDLYIGAKLALTEGHGVLPEIAIFPQMLVPSGSSAFTNGQVLPGFNLAYSWMLTDSIELECNTQVNRRSDSVDHFYTEVIHVFNLEYELTRNLGAFTEWVGFLPNGAIVTGPQYLFHGGFVYLVGDNIQLDVHAAVGLNRQADDYFVGSGVSVRF